uniref:Mic1 domain-containing protein n=1 Tax=Angiostrongylus cantonensis TaxID=6313 RepID=A0A158P883_ANGCA
MPLFRSRRRSPQYKIGQECNTEVSGIETARCGCRCGDGGAGGGGDFGGIGTGGGECASFGGGSYCWCRMFRINAELFELSADGTKWVMVDNRMMYISVYRNEMDRVRIIAISQTGRTVLDTTLSKDQKVEKISECFVFWRDVSGRTLGVNTLTAKDATLFVTHTEPSASSITPMSQHNIDAQVSINPLNMVFHHNHGLINVDLLECFITLADKPNVLHLAYASQIYELEFTGEANRFATKVLNMSSLLLARTTCTDVAVTFLNRQHQKHQEKLWQVGQMLIGKRYERY